MDIQIGKIKTAIKRKIRLGIAVKRKEEENPFSVLAFVFFVVLIFIIFGRGKNLWILPFIFGGGSSGRNSDSFRKGGGGSFGGGGASGRW